MDKFGLIAEMVRKFPGWEKVCDEDLRLLVVNELGSEKVFQEGVWLGNCQRLAIGPENALLICAGSMPHPSWQALTKLAILETKRIFVKLPDAPCADAVAEAALMMGESGLFKDVRISRDLPSEGVDLFDAVIVFGTSQTVDFFRKMVPWNKKFLGFGNKFSLAVVDARDVSLETGRSVVRDVVVYAQQGCLSPHVCYVCNGDADAMAQFCAQALGEAQAAGVLLGTRDVLAAARVYTTRRAELALGSKVLIPEDGSLDWTVILSSRDDFEVSPGSNVLRVKRCSSAERLVELLEPWRGSISTVAVSKNQTPILGTGATRFCALGKMQQPSVFWTQDGFCSLAQLVSWVCVED